ncbi:DUF1522 domain-containing protein, partial [Bradyrhizobium sp. CCBAU 51627]|uniref:DUF1522 domain-containing protein n=1 Tax=Bradyrhizobium sp. CCBAU 51627 TaxID=1325088 RepID=UPI002306C169
SGAVTLNTGTGADLSITGRSDLLKALGLTGAAGSGSVTVTQARSTSSTTLGTLIKDGSTLNVDGKTITFSNAKTPTTVATGSTQVGNLVTDGNGNSTVYLQAGNVNDVLNAID